MTVLAMARTMALRPPPMLVEQSMTRTTRFGPVLADRYHGRSRGSKSLGTPAGPRTNSAKGYRRQMPVADPKYCHRKLLSPALALNTASNSSV